VSTVRQAFDRHALIYDQVFSNAEIRSETWEIADRYLFPGMDLLDLGCGTGEDAVHFVQRGLKVTAIDISPLMIAQLKLKCGDRVRCEVADMREFAPTDASFDGVFSNFGALNCVSDLDWLNHLPLRPGSHLVLTTMGRLYPLEFVSFLLKGRPRLAFRRFGSSCEAVVQGVRFRVYYHRLRWIQKALREKFELKEVKGIRSLLPVPGLDHLEKFMPWRIVKPVDRWLCSHRLTAACSDHFVSVWRRRET